MSPRPVRACNGLLTPRDIDSTVAVTKVRVQPPTNEFIGPWASGDRKTIFQGFGAPLRHLANKPLLLGWPLIRTSRHPGVHVSAPRRQSQELEELGRIRRWQRRSGGEGARGPIRAAGAAGAGSYHEETDTSVSMMPGDTWGEKQPHSSAFSPQSLHKIR